MEKDGKTQDAILDYEQAKRFAAVDDYQPLLRLALAKKSLGGEKYQNVAPTGFSFDHLQKS